MRSLEALGPIPELIAREACHINRKDWSGAFEDPNANFEPMGLRRASNVQGQLPGAVVTGALPG